MNRIFLENLLHRLEQTKRKLVPPLRSKSWHVGPTGVSVHTDGQIQDAARQASENQVVAFRRMCLTDDLVRMLQGAYTLVVCQNTHALTDSQRKVYLRRRTCKRDGSAAAFYFKKD